MLDNGKILLEEHNIISLRTASVIDAGGHVALQMLPAAGRRWLGYVRRFEYHPQFMSKNTDKALKATIKHFEAAANHHGDAPHAITTTAAGLVCLTGIIGDLFQEIESLRAEVKALREQG